MVYSVPLFTSVSQSGIEQPLRMLVVDDDAITNQLLSRWLQQRGYRVFSAKSGEDALNGLSEYAPDIVFLDVVMPGINGLEVLERLRTQELDISVIMITALDTPETAIDALRRRADDYLRKPFNFDECHVVLERAVSRMSLRRQNALLRRQLDEKRRQLETELERAAAVQAGLLPQRVPRLPGFDLAATCLPAREVGGDFYDWYKPNPMTLNLTLGDVMGKGMAAALLMATTRAALQAVASQNSPGKAIALADQVLERDLDRAASFVTLFHAQLDLTTQCLTYIDAGHGHAFVWRADGRIELFEERGPPLGVLPEGYYIEGQLTLQQGDTLVLYSDGLLEACPPGGDSPIALVSHLEGLTVAAEMVACLLSLIDQATPLIDDLTIVVLHCTQEEIDPRSTNSNDTIE